MTNLSTAAATKRLISELPAGFMLDGATYARGGALGYDGLDFYAAGRGGVLGEVDADVVAAALIFFNPATVRDHWDRAAQVGPYRDAAVAFAECCHEWGRAHLDDETDHARLGDLLGRIVVEANPAGAPIFAGWRLLTPPGDPKARVAHYANALRELRGALHGAAVLANGIPPGVAVQTKSPHMASAFGWPDPIPEIDQFAERWSAADAATDAAFAPVFNALTDAEQDELIALGQQAVAGAR